MAVLAAAKPKGTGTQVTFAAVAAGGDDVPVSERTIVLIKNGGASPTTVTVTGSAGGSGVSQVTVPAGQEVAFPALLGASIAEGNGHANTGSGKVRLTYSATTSVTAAVISV